MKVLGFNFTKISAQRSNQLENIKITTNLSFKEPIKAPLEAKGKDVFTIPFGYDIDYNQEDKKSKKEESKAQLSFEGNLIVSADKKEAEEITKSWNSKESNSIIKTGVLNLILQKCNIKALSLEEELNLPIHISLPKLNLGN